MATKKPVREKGAVVAPENTRGCLIDAAKKLFAAMGFDGTTVKDISEEAGVNVSLVSYHFQGKEGLYRACLENFGRTRLSSAERILQTPTSREEFRIRLSMFIEEMLNWFLEEPELSMIIQRECDSGLPVASDVFKSSFLKIFELLTDFFESAHKRKLIKPGLDPQVVTRLIFGSFTSLSRSDQLTKRFHGVSITDPTYLKKVKEQAIALFVEGVLEKEKAEK